ncbi:MAG TPA: hypothetical protein VLE43_05925 [Candidatus Saccharimonadia bacterium]|nr:hypothetical protein [Candidatus Saccharimonadia bacterium]
MPPTFRLSPSAIVRWLLAFSPAIFVLLHILPLRLHVPYHDSWAFVKQYQDWMEGNYGWRDFFAPHNYHPSAPGKFIYFLVMHLCEGDLGILPVITWALAFIASLAVLGLARPLWSGHQWRGAGLMFLANLSLFTLAQGHSWIWDFVFQNAIPGACLAAALWLLSSDQVKAWRWVMAAFLAVTAAFSFGTGPIVGFLLLPAVWWASESSGPRCRWARVGVWCLMAVAAGWLALKFFVPGGSVAHPDNAGRIRDLAARPVDSVLYVCALLGHTLGQGTDVEAVDLCVLWGVVLLVVFLACAAFALTRRSAAMRREAWPWIALGLWAGINAMAICFGRMRALLETALAPRYSTFMLFFVLSTVMLAAWTIFRAGDGRLVRVLRAAATPAIAVLVVFNILAWETGSHSLETYRRRMNSEFAALTFTNALPPQREVQWQLDLADGTANLARFLKAHDRLPGVNFVEDAALSRWRTGEDSSDKWAHWELARHDDGTLEMTGVCGLTRDVFLTPDLVVVTAVTDGNPENIVALTAPQIPDDFFESAIRRREHYDHYFAWHWRVDRSVLPVGKEVTLQAYVLDLEKRKVRKIKGIAKLSPEV